jgi:hypothetical protein
MEEKGPHPSPLPRAGEGAGGGLQPPLPLAGEVG